jgi:hypothetical protein
MTPEEAAVYASGIAALLLVAPYLRVLQEKMEVTRARVFLKWALYLRMWRVLGLAGAGLVLTGVVFAATWEEEAIIQFFIPYGFLVVFFQAVVVYYIRLVIRVSRGMPGAEGRGP